MKHAILSSSLHITRRHLPAIALLLLALTSIGAAQDLDTVSITGTSPIRTQRLFQTLRWKRCS